MRRKAPSITLAIGLLASLVSLALLASLASPACADNMFGITYAVGVPNGDTRDYIPVTSWRGVGVEWRWERGTEMPVSFGFSMAWQVLSDRLTGTQQLENGAVTGIQDRYLNSLPFLVTMHYAAGSPRGVQMYFGGGVGAQYVIQRVHLGVNVLEETNWHLALVPEVGLTFPLGTVRGMFNVKYDHAFKAGTYIGGDSRAWQYWVASVGLVYTYW